MSAAPTPSGFLVPGACRGNEQNQSPGHPTSIWVKIQYPIRMATGRGRTHLRFGAHSHLDLLSNGGGGWMGRLWAGRRPRSEVGGPRSGKPATGFNIQCSISNVQPPRRGGLQGWISVGPGGDRAGEKENEQPIQPRMDADGHSAAEPQPKKQGHEKHEKPQRAQRNSRFMGFRSGESRRVLPNPFFVSFVSFVVKISRVPSCVPAHFLFSCLDRGASRGKILISNIHGSTGAFPIH